MPTSNLWRMADEMYDGELAARLTALRSAGESWDQIALVLSAEKGLRINRETLRTWGKQIGIDDEPAKAAS